MAVTIESGTLPDGTRFVRPGSGAPGGAQSPTNGTGALDDPFAGLDSALDPERVPKAFQSLFRKYRTCVIDGFTFYYREMSIADVIAVGGNPFLEEIINTEFGEDEGANQAKVEALFQNMLDVSDEERAELDRTTRLHRDKVILQCLHKIQLGDEVFDDIDPQIVISLSDEIREELYKVILIGDLEETETVRRFPDDPEDEGGEGTGVDDSPPSEDV